MNWLVRYLQETLKFDIKCRARSPRPKAAHSPSHSCGWCAHSLVTSIRRLTPARRTDQPVPEKPRLDSRGVKKRPDVSHLAPPVTMREKFQETRLWMGVAIGTFTLVVAACSMTGHYLREYRRMQRIRIFESANRHERPSRKTMVSGLGHTCCRTLEAAVVCRGILYLRICEIPCDVSHLLAGIIMSLTCGKGIQLSAQIGC